MDFPIATMQHRIEYIMRFAEIGEMRFNGWDYSRILIIRVVIPRHVEEIITDGVTWSNFTFMRARCSSDLHLESLRSLIQTHFYSTCANRYAFSISIAHPYSAETHFVDDRLFRVIRFHSRSCRFGEEERDEGGKQENYQTFHRLRSVNWDLVSPCKTTMWTKACVSHTRCKYYDFRG